LRERFKTALILPARCRIVALHDSNESTATCFCDVCKPYYSCSSSRCPQWNECSPPPPSFWLDVKWMRRDTAAAPQTPSFTQSSSISVRESRIRTHSSKKE